MTGAELDVAVPRPPLPLPILHPFLSSSSKSQSWAEWRSPGSTWVPPSLSLVALRPLDLPHGCGPGHGAMSGSSHKGTLSTGRLLPPPRPPLKQVCHLSRERLCPNTAQGQVAAVGRTDVPLPKSPPRMTWSHKLHSGLVSPGAQKETDQELGLQCTPSGLPSFTRLGCCGDLSDLWI